VAVCCALQDMEFAKKVVEGIEVHYIKCAVNENNKYKDADFIRNSKAILFIVSEFSVASEECFQQLKRAKETKKHIYSIWKEKAPLTPSQEAIIFRRQLVDFTEENKFRDSLSALVAGLRNIFNQAEGESGDTETVENSETTDLATFHPSRKIGPLDLVNEKMQYLYICHDHSDHEIANHLASLLLHHGFVCCAYNDVSQTVQDLVIECWALILVLSTKSAASSLVRDRIALAENRQKLILPVMVQKDAISFDPALTYTLARIPSFKFVKTDADLDPSVAKLVSAIKLAKKIKEKTDKVKLLRETINDYTIQLKEKEEELVEFTSKMGGKG